jgi:hydroxypyruvate isomerase
MLFNEVPFLDRFALAAKNGFSAVEFLFPYSYPNQQLKSLLKDNNLELALYNLPAGNWQLGERGIACLPDRMQEFRDGVSLAIDYAKTLGCSRLNSLAGIAPKGVHQNKLTQIMIENLGFAAEACARQGITLLIEPINTIDIPGFFLCNTEQAAKIIDSVGANNLKLQYDIYHMQIMEGNLISTIETYFNLIGHIQLADNPGRHEPGSGEINYPFLIHRIDELGYEGWIGCEYQPATNTSAGLKWIKTLTQ